MKLLERTTFDKAMVDASRAWGKSYGWPKTDEAHGVFDLWFRVLTAEGYRDDEFMYCLGRALSSANTVVNLPAVLNPFREAWAAGHKTTQHDYTNEGKRQELPYDNDAGRRACQLMHLILDDYEVPYGIATSYIIGSLSELPKLQFNGVRKEKDRLLSEKKSRAVEMARVIS